MLKIDMPKVHAHIKAYWFQEGSVLANTVKAGCEKIEINYQIESSETPEKIAALLTNARNGCFIRQSVAPGVPIEDTLTLNGEKFDFFSFAPLGEDS